MTFEWIVINMLFTFALPNGICLILEINQGPKYFHMSGKLIYIYITTDMTIYLLICTDIYDKTTDMYWDTI